MHYYLTFSLAGNFDFDNNFSVTEEENLKLFILKKIAPTLGSLIASNHK